MRPWHKVVFLLFTSPQLYAYCVQNSLKTPTFSNQIERLLCSFWKSVNGFFYGSACLIQHIETNYSCCEMTWNSNQFICHAQDVYNIYIISSLQTPRRQSRLFCRYHNNNRHPFYTLGPVKQEDEWDRPRIVRYHDIISEKEMEKVKELAKPRVSSTFIHVKMFINMYTINGQNLWTPPTPLVQSFLGWSPTFVIIYSPSCWRLFILGTKMKIFWILLCEFLSIHLKFHTIQIFMYPKVHKDIVKDLYEMKMRC